MTSVGVFSYPFPFAVHPPDLVIPDWSQKQLDKHRKEIQSLLGNLFLRITSVTIQTRILGVPAPTLAEIHKDEVEGSPNRLLLCVLLELPDRFKANMDKLEVSDALAAIINILRLVSYVLYFPILIPFADLYSILTFNTDRPTKHYTTLYCGMKILHLQTHMPFTPPHLRCCA
jgi:hypothetical protein